MSGFYFTFLIVMLAGAGARDQLTVARLTQSQGSRPAVLVVGIVCSLATAAAAAWGAAFVAPSLVPQARLILAALALGFAGAEALLLSPGRRPEEPTHSLFALSVVLLAQQVTDSVRFLVFAVAVATNAPVPAGLAGAVGGMALIAAGWFAPDYVTRPFAAKIRRGVGGGMVLLALFLALRAFGRI